MSPARIIIRVTVPESILRSEFVREEIARKMREKTAPEIRREFLKTVEGWEKKPDFSQKFTNSTSAVSTEVFPSGTNAGIYKLVNEGAPSHLIRPKGRGLLRFQVGYRAATSPRKISSRSKFRSGAVISTAMVHHPGFEARAFDEVIAQEYEKTFENDMQDAIKDATRRR